MRHTVKLFQIGLKQISRDKMLAVMLPAPFFIGMFFKFAIPYANQLLTEKFSFSITPWYGLADGMLICLTPMFTAIISAFLLLDEKDEGLYTFYQITPANGYSYLTARIGLPMVWAFAVTVLIAAVFNISSLSFGVILSGSLLGSLTGICLALMVASIAGSRVEGLALSKLMGISFMGLILIWFLPSPYCYALAFLPSFWIGKLLTDGPGIFSLLPGLAVCFLWTALFAGRFLRRV